MGQIVSFAVSSVLGNRATQLHLASFVPLSHGRRLNAQDDIAKTAAYRAARSVPIPLSPG